jgi:hypothetical protein
MSLFRQILAYLGLIRSDQTQEPVRQRQTFTITEQNVYTMVNTITFSTDMNKLYLVDAGRAIEFDLTKENGVLVGTLRGQITVATAFEFSKTEDGPSAGEATEGAVTMSAQRHLSTKLTTDMTVWSGAYHVKRRIICFIGATEIEVRKPNGDEEYDYKSEIHFFDIENNTLHIRRKKNNVFVTAFPNNEKES